MSRLTSVANVKRFLTLTTNGQDALIDRLIPTESSAVERYVGRRFGYQAISKRVNGSGTDTIVLPEQPIISVASLTVSGALIAASDANNSAGFVFDDSSITLTAAKFAPGVQNVIVVWAAGYQATENAVVPAATGNATTAALSPDSYGFPMAANAVSYTANGAALALSTAANGPLVGQFSFAEGVFTFNAADSGAPVTLVYPYAPADVEQAVIEMVGLDLRQRDNLGVTSKSLAGESVSYEKAGMNAGMKAMLQPYRRMAPG